MCVRGGGVVEVCTREREEVKETQLNRKREKVVSGKPHTEIKSFMAAFAQKQNLHARIKIK